MRAPALDPTVDCFGVDTDYPVVWGRTRDDRDVYVYRGRSGEIWTLDEDKVGRPGQRNAATILWTVAPPKCAEGRALLAQAAAEGLMINAV